MPPVRYTFALKKKGKKKKEVLKWPVTGGGAYVWIGPLPRGRGPAIDPATEIIIILLLVHAFIRGLLTGVGPPLLRDIVSTYTWPWKRRAWLVCVCVLSEFEKNTAFFGFLIFFPSPLLTQNSCLDYKNPYSYPLFIYLLELYPSIYLISFKNLNKTKINGYIIVHE